MVRLLCIDVWFSSWLVRKMSRDHAYFLLLNIGHFLDHFFTLIFATVAALILTLEWGIPYGELLIYATPGFFAFGLFALPAGWLADRWSRDAMMVVFFIGIGTMAIATSFAQTPFQIGLGLFSIGVFAAIYHPVGLAIVTMKWRNTGMRIAANGVWGNLGVACAALITGYFIDHGGWRVAFVAPGVFSIGLGMCYLWLRRENIAFEIAEPVHIKATDAPPLDPEYKRILVRVSAIVFLTTATASTIYQSTTFALPKMFDEQLAELATTLADQFAGGEIASVIGTLAFVVFAVASIAQLVVGALLDRIGPRKVYMSLAVIMIVFFLLMPGLTDSAALAVAFGFMFGAFGQIPINDYMIGKMASGPARARIFAVRYVVAFTVLAVTLPMIGFVHSNWGFEVLFGILASAATIILFAVALLPKQLPVAPAT